MNRENKTCIRAHLDDARYEAFKIKLIKDKKSIQEKIIEMVDKYLKS